MPYKDPEKAKAYSRARRQRPEEKKRRCLHAKEINRRPEVVARHRNWYLEKRYGLTAAAFNTMLAGQGGACAACGTKSPGSKGFVVDHNHATGAVRGILCFCCNVSAGMLKDSPVNARKIAAYLEKKI